MNTQIDFAVIGAQKCATSWLYYCLREHPELQLPSKKDDGDYVGSPNYEKSGPLAYFERLGPASPTKRRGEVSVEYMKDPRSPTALHDCAPDVKLVSLLRDPVDRAISAYYWNVRKACIPHVSVSSALRRGVTLGSDAPVTPHDSVCYDLIERGFYDIHLSRFLDLFPPSQVCIALYEEIAADPAMVLRRIFSFLGVKPDFQPASMNMRPKSNTYIRALIAAERIAPQSKLLSKLMDHVNVWFSRVGISARKPQLERGLTRSLQSCYRSHINGLEVILRSIPPTQRPGLERLGAAWGTAS